MNQDRVLFLFCLSFALLGSCKEAKEQAQASRPVIFALTVADLETSMDWYGTNLDFTADTVMSFPGYGVSVGMMHQGDFYLEFVEFENDLSPNDLEFQEGTSALNGFFKIGFQTTDIEGLFNRLNNKPGVNIIAPLDDLAAVQNIPWPELYFLMADPDGNYVQMFSTPANKPVPATLISPFLIASSSQNLDASIQWYEQNLKAQLIHRVGNAGNERAILDKDGLMIELGAFEGYVPLDSLQTPEGISLSQVHGIRKLSLMVPYIYKPYDRMLQNQVPFSFDLTEQKSMVGDRYFMISDDIGNAIQFFEKDQ